MFRGKYGAPGRTAASLDSLVHFLVVNLGNRPKTFKIQVEGVPERWIEQDAEEVLLFPFFGQRVRIGVTPSRSPETRSTPNTIVATAATDCASHSATATFKVNPFRQAGLDVYGGKALPAARMERGLLGAAHKAEKKAADMDLLVLARGPVDAAMARDIRRLGGRIKQEFTLAPGYSIRLPAGKVDDLTRLSWVDRVERNHGVEALLVRSGPALGARALWNLGLTGKGITVAVVDTGVDAGHPLLSHAVAKGYNALDGSDNTRDGHGHGTHVAGIIASRDEGYRGVAPEARILPVKVLDDEGYGTYESVAAGIEWAVNHGADIISLSLGGPGGDGSSLVARMIDAAVGRGVVAVVAAGNGGPDMVTIGTPADARLALTVGAVDNARQLAEWSSRGPTTDGRVKPDLVAPGVDVYSTFPGTAMTAMSGTSMSTPHISGLAALLLEGAGRVDPLLVREALKKTARDLGYGPNTQGAGFPDPLAALAYAREHSSIVQQEVFPGQVAAFTYTLRNLGNVTDTFRLTQSYYSFGLNKYEAYPDKLGDRGVAASGGSVTLAAGESRQATARVAVAADWAGMEDAVYPLAIVARSAADRGAMDYDYVSVKVRATKRSMVEYLKREVSRFRDDVTWTPTDPAYRADLLQQTDALAARVQVALDRVKGRDAAAADAALAGADAQAAALERDVGAQRARRLQATDADALLQDLARIRRHLDRALKTALEH